MNTTVLASILRTFLYAAGVTLVVSGLVACGGGDQARQADNVDRRDAASGTSIAELPQMLSVVSLEKISEVRMGRTTFDYTFRVSIKNDGQARADVVAQLVAVGKGTTILDGTVSVGVIDAGGVIASPADTVTLRHDRAYPFDPGALQWNIRSARAVVIRGIVTDDPVAGATVTVRSLSDQSVLATVLTDQNGAYATPSLAPSQLTSGYLVSASGGTSIGKPFAETLTAAYSLPQDYEQSHVTVLSTALVKAAKSKTQNPSDLAAEVLLLGGQAQAAGLYPTNFNTIEIAEQYASSASTEISRWGLPAFTDKIAFEITYPSPASSSATKCTTDGEDQICSALFPQAGGRLYDKSGVGVGNAIVDVPPVFSGCMTRVNARLSDGGNSLKVWYSILSANESSTCGSSLFTSAMRISLPSGDSVRVPGECAAESHPSMSQCHTRAAGIVPTYFLNDGPTQRISQDIHETLEPAPNTLTLSREFGSNLKRRPVTGSHLLSPAVLFINGYTLGGGFGGDGGTWGRLPELVRELRLPGDSNASSLIPYNFQWRTNANFLDVAKDLAQAVRYVHAQSGNRPVHIVAHSFGGVLARVTLQGLFSGFSPHEWNGVVASVTTLGTPHSGTQDTVGSVEGVLLPDGWVLGPDRPCMQISCYQAGLFAGIPDWAKNSLKEGGTIPAPGYVVSRLRKGLLDGTDPLPSGAKIQVLIGQFTESATATRRYSNGDRLITYDGQRFLPEMGVSREGLLFQARLGPALVTERVLGLKVGIRGTPGTEYVSGDGTAYFATREFAYVHTSFLVGDTFNPFLNNTIGPAREAEVDSTCIDPLTCAHDSWVNVRELLLSFYGGDPSPNFPGFPPAVSSVSCTAPTVGQTMVCTLVGSDLPATVSFTASNCGPTPMSVVAGGTAVQRQFRCTPLTAGVAVEVSYLVPGFIGPLQGVPTAVATAPPPQATAGVLNDTGITAAMCYRAGSDVLVSCVSAEAIALNDKQDGMVGRDVTHNTSSDGKAGFSYGLVPKPDGGYFDTTECVKDNISGLMWEGKPTTGFRSGGSIERGDSGGSYLRTYVNAVNALKVCGYSDWRLPTIVELMSVVDYGTATPGPTIDPVWFPNTQANSYWAGERLSGNNFYAWNVDFRTGGANAVNSGQWLAIRLVRSSQVSSGARFTFSGDGSEVMDTRTGLVWRRCAVGTTWSGSNCTGSATLFSHEQALAYAKTQTGWRLANLKELASLVDRSRSYPATNSAAFPAIPASSAWWTATPNVSDPSSAWVVGFDYAGDIGQGSRGGTGWVRLVRASQ